MSGLTFPPLDGGLPPVVMSGIGMEDFLLSLFAGIGAMGVACQFVPGLLLFTSVVRSIFCCSTAGIDRASGNGNST